MHPDLAGCEPCTRIITHLNQAANRKYQIDSRPVRKLAHARHVEHGEAACIAVTDHLIARWKRDPKMNYYLRPATIFAKSPFAMRIEDIQAVATTVTAAIESQDPAQRAYTEWMHRVFDKARELWSAAGMPLGTSARAFEAQARTILAKLGDGPPRPA